MKSQLDRGLSKVHRHARNIGDRGRFVIANPAGIDQTIVFVAGCQRSGTTMTSKIFEADPGAFVFHEMSSLSSGDKEERLRFNELDNVDRQIRWTRAPLVVAKPLVESARLTELLERFPNATVLWMIRDFRDVASSNIVRWGEQNGFDDLAPILARDQSNWRALNLSDETLDLVAELHADGLSPADAASLFWYTRNTLLFDQGLESSERVYLQRYAELVTEPDAAMRPFYAHIGVGYPTRPITSAIRTSSVGKGSNIELSPRIELLCDEMLSRLNAEVDAQMPA